MSMELLNLIRGVESRLGDILAEVEKRCKAVDDRMDRIEYRKKPGPKPRRKLNDE